MASRFLPARPLALRLVALLLALSLFCGVSAAQAQGAVEDINLKELRALIQKNKGKPVILNFFATWCPPCRAEIPMLVEMNDKYDGRVTFIGLTVDDARSIAKVLPFMARMGIDYPVYHAGSDIVQNFSISSIPFNVGYDKKGKMVFAYSGIVDEEDFDRMLQDLLK